MANRTNCGLIATLISSSGTNALIDTGSRATWNVNRGYPNALGAKKDPSEVVYDITEIHDEEEINCARDCMRVFT
jgi:hypothetical protein